MEFTTPPGEITGTAGFADTLPLTETFPVSPCAVADANAVNPLAATGTHVPDHTPAPVESSGIGGSPSLKLTLTVPVLIASPQSSTTSTAMGTGHEVGVLNPIPMLVKIGSSFEGVQLGGAGAVARGRASAVAVAETTSSSVTVCELPSPKVNVIVPL
jgi:hypothetical protein